VDAVSGCAMLVRLRAVELVGLLDECFFLYFEDLDWCLRAHDAGFEVLSVPRARVWHRGGASIGPASARTTLYSVRNHLQLAARRGRWRPGQVIWPLVICYHLGHLLLDSRTRSTAHFGALARGTWHACRKQMGVESG
jgi:GT2 family glycosyltransferase